MTFGKLKHINLAVWFYYKDIFRSSKNKFPIIKKGLSKAYIKFG